MPAQQSQSTDGKVGKCTQEHGHHLTSKEGDWRQVNMQDNRCPALLRGRLLREGRETGTCEPAGDASERLSPGSADASQLPLLPSSCPPASAPLGVSPEAPSRGWNPEVGGAHAEVSSVTVMDWPCPPVLSCWSCNPSTGVSEDKVFRRQLSEVLRVGPRSSRAVSLWDWNAHLRHSETVAIYQEGSPHQEPT